MSALLLEFRDVDCITHQELCRFASQGAKHALIEPVEASLHEERQVRDERRREDRDEGSPTIQRMFQSEPGTNRANSNEHADHCAHMSARSNHIHCIIVGAWANGDTAAA